MEILKELTKNGVLHAYLPPMQHASATCIGNIYIVGDRQQTFTITQTFMPTIELFVLFLSVVALHAVQPVWDYWKHRGRPYPPGLQPLPLIRIFLISQKTFPGLRQRSPGTSTPYISSYSLFLTVLISLHIIKKTNNLFSTYRFVVTTCTNY